MNPLFDVNSYKITHHKQYPTGMDYGFTYLESRGGIYKENLFFGLGYYLKKYFSAPVTKDQVMTAYERSKVHFGGDYFNLKDWLYIAEAYQGFFPVRIKAVAEGSVVPTGNLLVSIESTDDRFGWLPGWLETNLQRVWYPTTVATLARSCKTFMNRYVDETSDDPSVADRMLHDFGAGSVSSQESAGIGGLAHLLSFDTTDNGPALYYGQKYYGEFMAGTSIPAAEHSTVTSHGRNNEGAAYLHILNQFPASVVAFPPDSYDYFNAIENIVPEVIKASGNEMVVIRPDSGNPIEMVERSLIILDQKFGSTTNSKGYKVLNNVRIIQGDGVDPFTIEQILFRCKHYGFSVENVTIGMGAALLQKVDRDQSKLAFKCSAISVKGGLRPVFKDPVTDPGKTSKSGVLDLERLVDGSYRTVQRNSDTESCLQTYYHNGIIRTDSFDVIRKRARSHD